MQKVKLQEKTGTGMLWLHIPKHIKEHFGLRKGQAVWVDWIGDLPIMVVFFEKPEYYKKLLRDAVSNRDGSGIIDADSDAELFELDKPEEVNAE